MANKVKKFFIVGSLVAGLFMATTACDPKETNSGASQNQDSSTVLNSSSNQAGSSQNQESSSNVPATLVSITAINNKENYEWGEDLNVTLYANYSDGSSTVITDYQVNGYNANISGEQTVVYTYQGKTTSLNVKVNDPYLTNLSVINNKTEYKWGEDLDLTVSATYADNSTSEITDYTIEGYDKEKSGEQTVIVRYGSKTSTIKVKVSNPELVNISATSAKESYEWGEDLNLTVSATYEDNSTVEITDYTVEGYNKEVSGEQEITIKYEGKTFTMKVTVNNPVLVSITAVSNKDSYEQGDNLNLTVMANYSDGSSVEIKDYTVEGYNNQTVGEQELTVSFEDKSCSVSVSVKERLNQFPKNKLEEFLQLQGIKTDVIAPSANQEWTNSVEIEQDDSKYFAASTKDDGTIGVDSISDKYAVTLKTNGWKVEKSEGNYVATKDQGDVMVTFRTKNKIFFVRVDSYVEFPDKVIQGSIVTNKNKLAEGTKFVIGGIHSSFIVKDIEGDNLSTSYCACTESGPAKIEKNVLRFNLTKSDKYWTLTDAKGRKLGATDVGKLAWNEGSTEWTIVFSKSDVVIMNANRDYGRLCYDPIAKNLTTYKSISGTDLEYPQLFKLTETALIYPESISVSGKPELAIGKSTKMNLSYYPTNANTITSDVKWSSSNEKVATVENGVVKGVSLGNVTITAKTKSKNNYLEASFDLEIKEQTLDSWTIMLYLCGADLESDGGYATKDINEILNTPNQPEDVNFIIQTGGSRSWKSHGISGNQLGRYHVRNGQLVLDEKLPNASMGSQSTLEDFLNWGLSEYPANNTGLIFWNHGGALEGVCFDENYGGDGLFNSEIDAAFANVLGQGDNVTKLDFIGYDACLMQIQEFAEFNSHYFDYLVGSEEAEAGDGWVYNKWLDDVYADHSIDTILKENCDAFVDEYGDDQTLSYLDLSKMPNYFAKFEALAAAIKTTVKNNYYAFKNLLTSCKDFGDTWYQSGFQRFCEIDGYDFLTKLGANSTYSSFATQINEAKEAYKALVAYSRKGPAAGNANGLGIIAPVHISYPTSETSFVNWKALF